MVQNFQTRNFPLITQVEQSWSENIKAALGFLAPGAAIASGLKLSIPLSAGQPTTGLTPLLSDGYLQNGDAIAGPYGSRLIGAAPANAVNGFYFGLNGTYYAATPAKPTDILIGRVATDNGTPAGIRHVAQLYRNSRGLFVVRGQISLQRCVKGADVNLFTFERPAGIALDDIRIVHVQANVVAAPSTGNAADDNFVLKAGATTILTVTGTALGTPGVSVGTPAAAWVVPNANSLSIAYNQTDASSNLAGGLIDVKVVLELL